VEPVVAVVEPVVGVARPLVAPVVDLVQPLLGPVLVASGPLGDLVGTGSPAPGIGHLAEAGDREIGAGPAALAPASPTAVPGTGPIPVVETASAGGEPGVAPRDRRTCGPACTPAVGAAGHLWASAPGPVPLGGGAPAGGYVPATVPTSGGGTASAGSGGPDGAGAVAVLGGDDPAMAPPAGAMVGERDAAPSSWVSRPPSLPG
jgi:hypothetical protein